MSLWHGVVVFVAAFTAGMMNSVAGGGMLVTFPALVWIGLDPIQANVTSTVSLWPGSLGAMYGFRRELGDSRRWMLLLAPVSVVGGLIGAFLLLRTPSRLFAALVPYLILFATILFAAQEPITRSLQRYKGSSANAEGDVVQAASLRGLDATPARTAAATHTRWWVGAAMFQFGVAVYGGYFGAGIGILMLAALGLLGLSDIHQMNGLKNFFAVCINLVAGSYFAVRGSVDWAYAGVMIVGAIAGGYGGAGLARKLGRRFVRRAVIFIGIVMALSLLLR